MAKKWIKAAVAEGKGKLHKKLGVPEDKPIPEDKLRSAAHSKSGTLRKEAVLAMTLKGLSHKKKAKTHTDMQAKMYGKKKEK